MSNISHTKVKSYCSKTTPKGDTLKLLFGFQVLLDGHISNTGHAKFVPYCSKTTPRGTPKLLLGLQVLLDGVPLTEVDASWYRGQIGVVAQDPRLFSNTITANITYGCTHKTQVSHML